MVLRIHNIGGWLSLKSGEAFKLSADKRRPIRIDFNAEDDCAVHLVDENGAVTFLAAFRGLQSVEFTAGSAVPPAPGQEFEPLIVSATSKGTVWYRTVDGDTEHYSSTAESFVKVATRRTRNPELELMMFKQQQNERRRDALLANQIAAMWKELNERQEPVVQNVDPEPAEEPAANDNAAAEPEASADPDATPSVAGSVSARAASTVRGKQAPTSKGGKRTDA